MDIIGATYCSGIGAPEIAAPAIDWRVASEIEDFPRAVLQERFGYKPDGEHNQGEPYLHGDFTTMTPDEYRRRGVPLPDLIVAGTPCQDFSIAGLRKGLDGERGNLTLEFVKNVFAIVDARPDGKLAVLWENVPGVLSDKGNAFGNFLGAIVGANDAFVINGSWPVAGMVSGPRGRAAWIVRDAQYFGLAQRRKRVFLVVDFGNCVDPVAVLFERKSLQGHSKPIREGGKHITGGIGGVSRQGDKWPAEIAPAFARELKSDNFEMDHVSGTLAARDYKGIGGVVLQGATAFDCKGSQVSHDFELSQPLRAMNNDKSHPNGGGHVAVSTFSIMPQNSGKDYKARKVDVSQPLMASGATGGNQGGDFVLDHAQEGPRRIMPIECARLQGFPDNHTAIKYNGKPAKDGPQYKGYGNSMAVNVMKWLIDRMVVSMVAKANETKGMDCG